MTGTIVALVTSARTGTIRAEDGSRHSFSAAAVLGDFLALAVGQRVGFDVDRAQPHRAAVSVFREPIRATGAAARADSVPDLRYAGFSHQANVRSYRFEAVSLGQSNHRYVVTVDLALLKKHRISVQEAPALCLRKLAADLKDSRGAEGHQLGDADLLAIASSRAAAIERRKPRRPFTPHRGPPPPAASQDRRVVRQPAR